MSEIFFSVIQSILPNRMKVSKGKIMFNQKSQIALIIILSLFITVPITTAAETYTVNTVSHVEPLPPVHTINISSSIKNSTYMYDLLIPTTLQKQNLMDRIDLYVVGNDDFKKMMKEYLQYIWKKYPVQFTDVKDGENVITHITFAPESYHTSCLERAYSVAEATGSLHENYLGAASQDRELEHQLRTFISANSQYKVSDLNTIGASQTNSDPVLDEPRLCVRETWMLYLIDHAMWTPFETGGVSDPLQPTWDEDTHKKFMHYAALVFDSSISPSNRLIAENAAPEPDSWPKETIPCKNWPWPLSCDSFANFCDIVVKHYNHYYNPDGLGPGIAVGGAPDQTKDWADKARDLPDSNTDKYKYLGYASHFLTDVGNPEHTGREWDQKQKPEMHAYYEGWVWTELSTLQYEMYESQDYSTTTGPAQMVKENAAVSHVYLDTIYNGIEKETNPSEWSKNETLKKEISGITKRLFRNTAYHTRSLVAYVIKKTDNEGSTEVMREASHV